MSACISPAASSQICFIMQSGLLKMPMPPGGSYATRSVLLCAWVWLQLICMTLPAAADGTACQTCSAAM